MKTIVTLYRRDKLKRIQEWSIEVERTSFRTTEGLIDGVKSTSQWTECFGKNLGRANETSPGEQAHKEANSRIRMKLEEGWTDKLDEIDIVIKKVSPMLAENWQDYKSKILD
jgi:DNA ligase-1